MVMSGADFASALVADLRVLFFDLGLRMVTVSSRQNLRDERRNHDTRP
jgi:hypothetical protein